jgi:hypothetical protein
MEFLAVSFVLIRGRARRQRAQFVNQEKTMTSISKLALLATFAAAGIASPAFAQSDANSHSHRIPAHLSGRLFDMAPQNVSARDSDIPSATGGGSVGYNQMLYNW